MKKKINIISLVFLSLTVVSLFCLSFLLYYRIDNLIIIQQADYLFDWIDFCIKELISVLIPMVTMLALLIIGIIALISYNKDSISNFIKSIKEKKHNSKQKKLDKMKAKIAELEKDGQFESSVIKKDDV